MARLRLKENNVWVDVPSLVGPQGPQGPTGSTGPQGPAGQTGPAGPGVAQGGTANQVLAKNSSTDYDTKWMDVNSAEWGNITGTLSNQTDLQNELNDIRAVAQGKTKSYVVSIVQNPQFNTVATSFVSSTSLVDINGNIIPVTNLKLGDNVYVQELEVPDRWTSAPVEGNVTFYQLETAKIPVTDVQLNGTSKVQNGIANIIVSGTNDGTNWTTLNIDGTSKAIPQAPSTYLKNASVSNNVLTLTKQDNSTVTYSPESNVFIATYGTTTYADITNANTAGKAIKVRGSVMEGTISITFEADYISTNWQHNFAGECLVGGASSTPVHINIAVSSSNTWSYARVSYEDSANKVTSISSSSTDTQYPSAKCVYDNLATRARTFVMSANTNSELATQSTVAIVTGALTDINGVTYNYNSFNPGDIIDVVEENYPSRWCGTISQEPTVVPAGYTQFSYISSRAGYGATGGGYFALTTSQVNTVNGDYSVEIKFRPNSLTQISNYGCVFGTNSNMQFGVNANGTANRGNASSSSVFFYENTWAIITGVLSTNESNSNYYVDGVNTNLPRNFGAVPSIFVNNGGTDKAYGDIAYIKLWLNGTLVHHYVPAKNNSTDVIGFYDVTANEFIGPAGGTCTSGPIIGSGLQIHSQAIDMSNIKIIKRNGTALTPTTQGVVNIEVPTNTEFKSNKVTSISSSSTNDQYPSAKCVYDAIDAVPVVSGTNDGTKWVSMTIDGVTKSFPEGPSEYLRTASVNNNTLTITKQDSTTVSFTANNEIVASLYNGSNTYSAGNLVIYNTYLYKCLASTTGTWDPTKWIQTNVATCIEESRVGILNLL